MAGNAFPSSVVSAEPPLHKLPAIFRGSTVNIFRLQTAKQQACMFCIVVVDRHQGMQQSEELRTHKNLITYIDTIYCSCRSFMCVFLYYILFIHEKVGYCLHECFSGRQFN